MSRRPTTSTTTSRPAAAPGESPATSGSTTRCTTASSWVEPARRLAGGAEEVLEQRNQHDEHEAVEQRGEKGGGEAEREQAAVGPHHAGGAGARPAAVTRVAG